MRRALFRKLVADVRASYWFIPGCLVLFAALAATGTLTLDRAENLSREMSPGVFPRLDVEGMRTILSVIAQSVIGVAGVMFSITMVAVSHASGQFGPRLIGNFMRDRGNQWTLGVLIATFVYAFIVLRSVGAADAIDGFEPHLSLFVAMVLAFLSVGAVIYYVHHVPETINVANISAALGQRLLAQLQATARERAASRRAPSGSSDREVCLGEGGYIQQIDIETLASVAERVQDDIWLTIRPGDFVTPHTCVAVIGFADADALRDARDCFALGKQRTEDQDFTFLIDQQVEMIARAMSPGVNDPQTAINCLNWLAAALVTADRAGVEFGLCGQGRVHTMPLCWGDLLDLSFGDSWDYVRPDRLARTVWCRHLDDLAEKIRPDNAATLARFRDGMKARAAD